MCYVSEMIRGLLHPADPKKKYTMVKNKYKDHSTHKSPSPPKEKPIMISQLQFKKVQSSQDSPNQSQLGLKPNMSRTGSIKMTRKSSNHSGLGSRLEKGSTPGESHREPDNTITINNVASSVAYFKPSVGPGQPWNYSDYKKKFLHLQEKDNTAEKKNVTKKLPAFVSICSLKKKRKESMANTMEGYKERNNSVDLSEALRLEEGNPDERFYLRKHISNPIIGRPRFNSLNQNSNSHSFLRQTALTMNVHPKELAGRTSSAKMIRYQSRSLSSADILKISNIQIEQ